MGNGVSMSCQRAMCQSIRGGADTPPSGTVVLLAHYFSAREVRGLAAISR